jgi:hypothetical protein
MIYLDGVKITKANLLIDHLNSISAYKLKKDERKISRNFLQICIRKPIKCRQRKEHL